MSSKQDTLMKSDLKMKASSRHPEVGNKLPISTTNDELMSVLMLFKKEILASNKTLSDSQNTQFSDLKKNFKHVSDQIAELKAENSVIHFHPHLSLSDLVKQNQTIRDP